MKRGPKVQQPVKPTILTKRKYTGSEVWYLRQNSYAFHFDQFQKAQRFDGAIVKYMVSACSMFDKPTVNFFGNVNADYFEGANWDRLMTAGKMYQMEASLLILWYWSVEGWAEFLEMFNNLEEPEKLSTYDVHGLKLSPQVVEN